MAVQSLEKPMEGVVEVDETYVGGAPRNRGDGKGRSGRGTKKQPVVALVQRNGSVISGPVERVNKKTLRAAIHDFVTPMPMLTDDLNSYRGITPNHHAVNHTRGEYVRREADGFLAYTNTAESYFALIKSAATTASTT